jgi:hypothetical protein
VAREAEPRADQLRSARSTSGEPAGPGGPAHYAEPTLPTPAELGVTATYTEAVPSTSGTSGSGERRCHQTPRLADRLDRVTYGDRYVDPDDYVSRQSCAIQLGLVHGPRGAAPGSRTACSPRPAPGSSSTCDFEVGCPPDKRNLEGQRWGLPPYVPAALAATDHESWGATVRSALRDAHGLPIDHVTAVWRLFWMLASGSAADGVYVTYPATELLAVASRKPPAAAPGCAPLGGGNRVDRLPVVWFQARARHR